MVAVLLNAFARTEEEFLKLSVEAREFSGACANVILIYRDTIYVANLGDCRAVLGRSRGKAIGLSRDHKASIEKSRIRKVGGFVKNGRVNGILAISRTIGDREFKDPVSMSSGTSSPTPSSAQFSSRPGQSARPGAAASAIPVGHMSITRRVSNPSNIVLKNVRDNADSPARTRRNGSSSLTLSSSNPNLNGTEANTNPLSKSAALDNTSTSREPSPSPIPYSVVASPDRPLHASTGSFAVTESSPSESKSKKRRSTGSMKKSRPPPKSVAADSESSDSVLYPIKQEEEEPTSKEDADEDTNDGDMESMKKAKSAPLEPASKSGKSSPPPVKSASNTSVSSSASSSADESSGLRKSKKDALASSSESFESEGSEAVEGLFDVIECYDAESKQKKFGFKKRRPPKDPKYDTATVVSAIPEITIMRRTAEDDWIFLASDGFYDLFTSKQTGSAVSKHLARCGRDKLTDTVKSLCEEASLLGSEDDITGVLILIKSIPSTNLEVALSNINLMAGSSEPMSP